MDFPKISLIVVNKNYDDLAADMFRTIKEQSFQNYEMIVVDYGSDNPNKIIKMAESYDYDNLITLQTSCELQNARNAGVKMARGKYISVLELDAIYEDKWLETLLNVLKASSDDTAYAYCDYWYMRGGEKKECVTPEFNPENVKSWQTNSLIKNKYFTGFDPSFRKLQDWDLHLSIVNTHNVKGVRVGKFLWTHIQPKGRTISWRLIDRHGYYKKKLIEKYPKSIFKG